VLPLPLPPPEILTDKSGFFYTYILISELNNRRYFGSCEDLKKRLMYHNSGKVPSTKPYRPYRILYYEVYETKREALQREKFFKTINGYKYLKELKII
jgi:putative endonuclease